MSQPRLPARWLAELHARAAQPPRQPRVPLRWRGNAIGSVEPAFVQALQARAQRPLPWQAGEQGIDIHADPLSPALDVLAQAMRDAGLVHAWRDEQLAVRDEAGAVLGAVERGAVRALGIATHAVHLIGCTPDGRHWVQQRAWSKANDPGLWDTLMGGMVPAAEGLEAALARETWEEAGLRLEQLQALGWGGRVSTRGPSSESAHGYVVETIDWYRCTLAPGVAPCNQDGEVDHFECLPPALLRERLLANAFTTEAALVFAAAALHQP